MVTKYQKFGDAYKADLRNCRSDPPRGTPLGADDEPAVQGPLQPLWAEA